MGQSEVTAFELIDSIFSRPQKGLPPNRRVITREQRRYLEDLIGQDEDGGAIKQGPSGSVVWSPKGRFRYVIGDDPESGKLSLMRFATAASELLPRLF